MSSQSNDTDIAGSFIVWLDYGCENWQPRSFNSIEEALKSEKYAEWIITKRVDFKATEV